MTMKNNIYKGYKYVLSCFLKRSVDLEFLMWIGRPFHTLDPATEKAWLPAFLKVCGMFKLCCAHYMWE